MVWMRMVWMRMRAKMLRRFRRGWIPPFSPPSFVATYYILLKAPETTMIKGRSTLPIQQMMMMTAEVCLPLLPCLQAKPMEEVRSGRQEMGQIPEEAVPLLSHWKLQGSHCWIIARTATTTTISCFGKWWFTWCTRTGLSQSRGIVKTELTLSTESVSMSFTARNKLSNVRRIVLSISWWMLRWWLYLTKTTSQRTIVHPTIALWTIKNSRWLSIKK